MTDLINLNRFKIFIHVPGTEGATGHVGENLEGGPVGEEVEGVSEEHGLDVRDHLHLTHVVVDLRLGPNHSRVADGLCK